MADEIIEQGGQKFSEIGDNVDVTSIECKVNPDNNSVDVSIYFTILNTQTPQCLHSYSIRLLI